MTTKKMRKIVSDIKKCSIDFTHKNFVIINEFDCEDRFPIYVKEEKFYCAECVKKLIDQNKLKPIGEHKHA